MFQIPFVVRQVVAIFAFWYVWLYESIGGFWSSIWAISGFCYRQMMIRRKNPCLSSYFKQVDVSDGHVCLNSFKCCTWPLLKFKLQLCVSPAKAYDKFCALRSFTNLFRLFLRNCWIAGLMKFSKSVLKLWGRLSQKNCFRRLLQLLKMWHKRTLLLSVSAVNVCWCDTA